MDLRSSESHNDDEFGHRKSIKEYLFETQPKIIELLTEELDGALKIMKGKDARRLQKYL